MVVQGWIHSTVTQCHLHKLAKQGFMTAAELTGCRVPKDPTFPAPAEGYVVSFLVFYEQEFGMPSH
jgi:hypothetical protein